MADFILTYTEDAAEQSLYLRVSETVAKVFAAGLKGAGFTDVALSSQKTVTKKVTVADDVTAPPAPDVVTDVP